MNEKEAKRSFYLYLDTSHLQKWQQRTLSESELDFLDKLKLSEKYKFVLSHVHLDEIAIRDDEKKKNELIDFLDGLKKIWIINSHSTKIWELKRAVNLFKAENGGVKVGPAAIANQIFSSDWVDIYIPSIYFLEYIPLYRNKSVKDFYHEVLKRLNTQEEKKKKENFNNQLKEWSAYQHAAASTKNPPKTPQWRKKCIERFKQEILKLISKELPQEILFVLTEWERFFDWLMADLTHIPSLALLFFTQQTLHRNHSNWESGNIGDLSHLSALPYVDYFTADKRIHQLTNQAIKLMGIEDTRYGWSKKIYKSIEIIPEFLFEKT